MARLEDGLEEESKKMWTGAEKKSHGDIAERSRREASWSPLYMVGSLAEWALGLTSHDSYRQFQVNYLLYLPISIQNIDFNIFLRRTRERRWSTFS